MARTMEVVGVNNAMQYLYRSVNEVLGYALRKVLRGIMILFSWFVVPYSRYHNYGKGKEKLPPIRSPLLLIPAVKLAQLIRNQQLTSEELIRTYIERCKEVNPFINAIVDERFADALDEARSIDRRIAAGTMTVTQMEIDTPLLGLPITVKESIAVRGLSHQGGRLLKNKNIATEDAPSVAQARKHGGIVLLVSNTPELCMCWETYNKVTGQTKNPYNLNRTSGGSSGGESALIASAASLIGLSSDIAGSSRLPAMFTGIYGHKPTPYAVSPDGHIPKTDVPNWGNFFTIAPMARYATDLQLLLKCICDPSSGSKLRLHEDAALDKIKFYYMENDGPSGATQPISVDIARALSDVAAHFNATKIKIDNLKWALEISMSAMLRIENVETIYYRTEGSQQPESTTLGRETLKYLMGTSDSTFPSVVVGHLQALTKMFPQVCHTKMADIAIDLKKEFLERLGTNGVFLYPTFPTTAHPHYEIYHKLVDTGYMMVFNTIGLPVTNCMVRLDSDSLPIGIQVITNPGQDHLLLATARAIESKFGGWVRPPS